MSSHKSDYESVLAEYSNREKVVALLGQHRPYLEMLPSMRRPIDSMISIPLPLARIRNLSTIANHDDSQFKINQTIAIPCDLAILMCDPEWKIKMGVEIMIFIHRPQEDFSELLKRWRQTQIYLDHEYEWIMPATEDHMFSDLAEQINPLFILFEHSPHRIKKGLKGASLPYLEYHSESLTLESNHNSLDNFPSVNLDNE